MSLESAGGKQVKVPVHRMNLLNQKTTYIEVTEVKRQKDIHIRNGEWENRTPDLVHAKHALYQLS
jgi:hypothetical protein